VKRPKVNEIMVGVFALAGVFLLVLLLVLMGGLGGIFGRTSVIEARFADVQGLQIGDPVYLLGMKIGKVNGISLLPQNASAPAQVAVSMVIAESYRPFILADSSTKIAKSLTGNISVLIGGSDGGNGAPLREGASLSGQAAVDLKDLTEKVYVVLGQAEKVIAILDRMVRDIEEKGDIKSALANIAALSGEITAELRPVREALQKTLDAALGLIEENRLDIRHTMANLKETSAAAKGLTERLASAPAQVEASLEILEKAGRSVKALLDESRPNVEQILADLRKTATSAANLSSEVQRRPWRLLYKPSEGEMRALELYDAAWAYNLGATELHRSVRDLATRLEHGSETAEGRELLEGALEQVRTSLKRQRDAEELFWKRLGAQP
jgi:phospholipid/cholesterol/gamma-HCH transport system substrate-binding protein